MKISNEPIVINYQKKPLECRCCGRAFEENESEFGALKEFEVTVSGLFEWTDWNNEENFKEYVPYHEGKLDEDDLKRTVRDYVYNDIYFYACSSEDVLKIEQSEINKFYEAVKSEIIKLLN